MSHRKVLELAKKFAEKGLNEQYQQQRDRLEEFAYDFTDKMRAILNEMAGDLSTLREKGYDKTQWKQLGNLYQRLIELRKDFDYNKPYPSAERVINFIFSKEIFGILQNLHSTIQKHLKENEVDFGPSKGLSQARVDSIQKLVKLMHTAKDHIKKNPLLAEVLQPSAPAPQLPPSSDYKPVSSEALTNPDIKIK